MSGYLSYGLRPLFYAGTLLFSLPVCAQQLPEMTAPATYRVAFADKQGSPFSLSHPEAFLSARSLQRRSRQGISIEENDLPVSPAYIDSISATGATVFGISPVFPGNAVPVSMIEPMLFT